MMFCICSRHAVVGPLPSGMSDDVPRLSPTTREELTQALVYALAFRRGKRHRHAERISFQIAADVLVDHLERAGFVVMKRPVAGDHAAPDYLQKAGLTD